MITKLGTDTLQLKGWWELAVHDQCAEDGVTVRVEEIPSRLVHHYQRVNNAIVDSGLDLILRRVFEGAALAVITKIQLGTSAAAFSRTQTGCQSAIVSGGLEEATATLAFFSRVAGGGFSDRASLSKSFTATADHNVAELAARSATPRCLSRIVASQVVGNTQVFTATYNLDINTV